MASKSRARATAKSARTGSYKRSEVGKASRRATSRLRIQVGKSGIYHNQRMFRSLDRAMDFAASLPSNQKSMIIGHGNYNNTNQYQGKPNGFGALTGWARNDYYAVYGDDLKDEDERIFSGGAKTYYVRWSDI